MTRKVTKAIFPVAGLGTRFLPATKSVPKEIMTLVDKPLVQYAIDEAREAGIEEFIFVTSRGKGALEDYFDSSPQLEASLEVNHVAGMVEKPAAGTAPSNLAVIGRYILAPTVLDNLNHITPGAGGELQLTDAIAMEIEKGRGVYGFEFEGRRYDCGSKAGYLQATVAFALSNPELRDEFSMYLDGVINQKMAAE